MQFRQEPSPTRPSPCISHTHTRPTLLTPFPLAGHGRLGIGGQQTLSNITSRLALAKYGRSTATFNQLPQEVREAFRIMVREAAAAEFAAQGAPAGGGGGGGVV